jgi:hypothetical protein
MLAFLCDSERLLVPCWHRQRLCIKELHQQERINTWGYSSASDKSASGAKPLPPNSLVLLIGMAQMQHEMFSQQQTLLETYQVRQ